MAKRGININNLNNKENIIKLIINQANSLNKKIKEFKESGIEEHQEFVTSMLYGLAEFTDSGTVSKSKKKYRQKSNLWLKKTLSALHKVNNNDMYGTVLKYETNVTDSIKRVQEYTKELLQKKGYSDNFIASIIYDKSYFANLFNAFKEITSGYGSDQVIEKVALTYKDNNLSLKQVNKIINNIENSRLASKRIEEELREYNEFIKYRNRKGR